MAERKTLDTKEVAILLGKSTDKVRRMCQKEKLAGAFQKRKGQPWRIPVEALAKYGIKPEEVDDRLAKVYNRKAESIASNNENYSAHNGGFFATILNVVFDKWLPSAPSRIAAIVAILTLFFTAVAGIAAFPQAQRQFIEWGFIREFPKSAPNDLLIVVAAFYHADNVKGTEGHDEIQIGINSAKAELGLDNLQVKISSVTLQNHERKRAERLGNRYNADMVIWGEVSDVRTSVNFLNLMNPCFCAAEVSTSVTDAELERLNPPKSRSDFTTEDLPRQLTYFSLFAISEFAYVESGIQSAIPILEKAVESLEDDSHLDGSDDAYFRLGFYYQFLHNLQKAERNYSTALFINPDYWDIYSNRAIVRAGLGDYSGALQDLDIAIIHESDEPLLYLQRSSTHLQAGNLEKASQDYAEYQQLAPSSSITDPDLQPLILGMEGFLLSDIGSDEDAIEYLNKAIASDPSIPILYSMRGIVYSEMEEYQKSIADFNLAVELGLNAATVYFSRGDSYFELKEYEQAIQDYSEFLTFTPAKGSPEDRMVPYAYFYRGIALDEIGNPAQALQDFEQAIQLCSEDPYFFNSRGIVNNKLENYQQAIDDYSQALLVKPDYVDPLYNRAVSYYNLGDITNACIDMQNYKEACEAIGSCYEISQQFSVCR